MAGEAKRRPIDRSVVSLQPIPDLLRLSDRISSPPGGFVAHTIMLREGQDLQTWLNYPLAPELSPIDTAYFQLPEEVRAQDRRLVIATRGPRGVWLEAGDVFDPEERRHNPVWNGFLKTFGIERFVTVMDGLGHGIDMLTYITIASGTRWGTPDPSTLATYRAASRAIIERRVMLAEHEESPALVGLDLLESSRIPALVIDREGRVRRANTLATAFVAEHRALNLDGERLVLADRSASARFEATLAKAHRGDETGPWTIRTLETGLVREVVLKVFAPTVEEDDRDFVFVVMTDPSRRVPPSSELLDAIGLTEREVRVAADIANGRSAFEMALMHAMSSTTVKAIRTRIRDKLMAPDDTDLRDALNRLAL